jgi:peptidoglycan/LPS O-acetylase OafA/YrhL
VKAGFQIPSLDGLRAVAFGIVFAAHAGLSHIVPGAFGVTVFFFLSGYLITTLMRLEYEKSGRVSLKHFYLRRVLRIHPPFYLVLVLAVLGALAGVVPASLDWPPLVALALHYANYWFVAHGFSGIPAGTGVYWSLAVEEHFYLLFPLLFLWLVRLRLTPRAQASVLLGLCVLLLAWRFVLVLALSASEDRTAIASDTRFDSLLFGCALALFGNPALDTSAFGERTWKRLFLPLGLAGLLLTFLVRDELFRETLRYSIQGVCLVPVFVCAVRYSSWWPMRVLNLKPVAYVGAISYSLYLMHQVLIYTAIAHFEARVSRLVIALGVLVVALLGAFVIHQTVEKPCARLRRRLHE